MSIIKKAQRIIDIFGDKAISAVDEIIKEYEDEIIYAAYDGDRETWTDRQKYWKSVKSHIGNSIPEIGKDVFVRIDILDSDGEHSHFENAIGSIDENNQWQINLPSVYDYPANYFEGDFEVISWTYLNFKNQSNEHKKSIQ